MPRTITEEALLELQSGVCRPCFLVSIDFDDETVFAWTGIGDLIWGGNTYKGIGTLGTISPIVESMDTQAQGITLTLSGIDTSLLAEGLGHVSTQGKASVYFGFLTPDGSLVDSPILQYKGWTDAPSIDMGVETNSLSINVENALVDLQRIRGGRYTDSDQRARYPDDGGLKYVAWLQDMTLRLSFKS